MHTAYNKLKWEHAFQICSESNMHMYFQKKHMTDSCSLKYGVT